MIPQLPFFISFVFGLTSILTLYIFYRASHYSKQTLVILSVWMGVQALVALSGFYTVTNALPPRFIFLIMIPVLMILALFLTKPGREYVDSLDVKWLTFLHIIRIPVELVLFWLFLHKAVPQLITFEGKNFDILSGISAGFIYYFGYLKNKISKAVLLIWNFICLGLLFNVVIHAVLSAPFPFQKFGFEQPNIAVLYFPFVWLPCLVVPLVLLSHLVCIRRLLKV